MIIGITGTGSGVGQAIVDCLRTSTKHKIISISRSTLDLADIPAVLSYKLPAVDVFINCAGTGHGGKITFTQHLPQYVAEILNTNVIAPVLLSQKALIQNPTCRILNQCLLR
jgi:short-subunit dehydrogenase